MHRYLSVLGISVLMSMLSAPALAGGAILFKLGAMQLQDTRQELDLVQRDLDAISQSALGIQFEHRFRKNGVAIGVEYNIYRHEYSPPAGSPGTAETRAIMVSARNYFLKDSAVRPFVGFGIGVGRTDVDHGGVTPYSDREYTTPFQVAAGVEFRADNLSFLVEGKYMHHDIEGGGNEYDPTAIGLFAGFGFNW